MLTKIDREEATKEDDFTLADDEDEEEEEWEGEAEWALDGEDAEGDVKDESAAYLEFLNEEVWCNPSVISGIFLILFESGSEVWRSRRR